MTIRDFLALYRAKDAVFGHMPEPQFRMLLDLAEGGDRDTTGLSLLSGAPATTALRHLGEMVEQGLIERRSDHLDRRRTIYTLAERGAQAIRSMTHPEAAR